MLPSETRRKDTERMRSTPKGLKPFVMTNLKTLSGVADVVTDRADEDGLVKAFVRLGLIDG